MSKFNIGDKVKLTDYTTYNDYRRHVNQVAIIVDRDYEKSFRIKWEDGEHSLADEWDLIMEKEELVIAGIVQFWKQQGVL